MGGARRREPLSARSRASNSPRVAWWSRSTPSFSSGRSRPHPSGAGSSPASRSSRWSGQRCFLVSAGCEGGTAAGADAASSARTTSTPRRKACPAPSAVLFAHAPAVPTRGYNNLDTRHDPHERSISVSLAVTSADDRDDHQVDPARCPDHPRGRVDRGMLSGAIPQNDRTELPAFRRRGLHGRDEHTQPVHVDRVLAVRTGSPRLLAGQGRRSRSPGPALVNDLVIGTPSRLRRLRPMAGRRARVRSRVGMAASVDGRHELGRHGGPEWKVAPHRHDAHRPQSSVDSVARSSDGPRP